MTLRQAQGTARQAQGTKIVVITAGLRQPSSSRLLADRLAAVTAEQLAGAEITTVELREYARDLTNHLLTGFPSTHLSRLLDDVTSADALIAVSPIFSGSYSGLFKTFFDVLEPGVLAGKPVLIGATGGTARHSLVLDHALRPLFTYLQAVVVPTGVYAAPEDWGSDAQLGARTARAAGELAALVAPRSPANHPPNEDDHVIDFERLLAGLGERR
jgi:FMN reductase